MLKKKEKQFPVSDCFSVRYLGIRIRMLRGLLMQKIRNQSFRRSEEQHFHRAREPVNWTSSAPSTVTFSLSKNSVSATIYFSETFKQCLLTRKTHFDFWAARITWLLSTLMLMTLFPPCWLTARLVTKNKEKWREGRCGVSSQRSRIVSLWLLRSGEQEIKKHFRAQWEIHQTQILLQVLY